MAKGRSRVYNTRPGRGDQREQPVWSAVYFIVADVPQAEADAASAAFNDAHSAGMRDAFAAVDAYWRARIGTNHTFRPEDVIEHTRRIAAEYGLSVSGPADDPAKGGQP